MRTVNAISPDGDRWHVHVVWEPRWRALARRYGGWRRKRGHGSDPDVGELGVGDVDGGGRGGGGHSGGGRARGGGFFDNIGDDIAAAVLIVIAVIVFGLLFWWLLLPLLLLLVDVIVVVALVIAGGVGRMLTHRPWEVTAVRVAGGVPGVTRDRPAQVTVNVHGWRRALRKRDEIAAGIRSGQPLEA